MDKYSQSAIMSLQFTLISHMQLHYEFLNASGFLRILSQKGEFKLFLILKKMSIFLMFHTHYSLGPEVK